MALLGSNGRTAWGPRPLPWKVFQGVLLTYRTRQNPGCNGGFATCWLSPACVVSRQIASYSRPGGARIWRNAHGRRSPIDQPRGVRVLGRNRFVSAARHPIFAGEIIVGPPRQRRASGGLSSHGQSQSTSSITFVASRQPDPTTGYFRHQKVDRSAARRGCAESGSLPSPLTPRQEPRDTCIAPIPGSTASTPRHVAPYQRRRGSDYA